MIGLVGAGLGRDLMDAGDIVRRNDVLNVEKELSEVTVKVLVVGVEEDEQFSGKESIRPTAAAIPCAKPCN